MNDIQAEIDRIRQERATKGGRMSNAEKERIAELEAMTEEPVTETTETPGMVRVMIMNRSAGMPGGKAGGAVKVYQFDVVETTTEHAEALCNAVSGSGDQMARRTEDPVTVQIIDGERVEV